jgi:hypothetical protein
LTTQTLQTLVPLAPGDTVEQQGSVRAADGHFAADHLAGIAMKLRWFGPNP